VSAADVPRVGRRRSIISLLLPAIVVAIALTLPAFAEADDAGPLAAGPAWSSDFSSGNFHQWSWWGQGQQSIWGRIGVVRAPGVGVPELRKGHRNIARMTVTSSGLRVGKINAKLYKGFGYYRNGVAHEPSNVSGTYSAWYYIPSSFKIRSTDEWSNIFQFKEQYALPGGGSQSDPLWWVELNSAAWGWSMAGAKWVGPQPQDPDQPVAVLNRWCNDWKRQVVLEAVPLNRWFKISAALTQGKRISFSIDGRHFDTAYASQYPVSPFHAGGQEWIFGVGNYSIAPDTTLYVGQASYRATPAAAAARVRSRRG
jgi:hypothetical protein